MEINGFYSLAKRVGRRVNYKGIWTVFSVDTEICSANVSSNCAFHPLNILCLIIMGSSVKRIQWHINDIHGPACLIIVLKFLGWNVDIMEERDAWWHLVSRAFDGSFCFNSKLGFCFSMQVNADRSAFIGDGWHGRQIIGF